MPATPDTVYAERREEVTGHRGGPGTARQPLESRRAEVR